MLTSMKSLALKGIDRNFILIQEIIRAHIFSRDVLMELRSRGYECEFTYIESKGGKRRLGFVVSKMLESRHRGCAPCMVPLKAFQDRHGEYHCLHYNNCAPYHIYGCSVADATKDRLGIKFVRENLSKYTV